MRFSCGLTLFQIAACSACDRLPGTAASCLHPICRNQNASGLLNYE